MSLLNFFKERNLWKYFGSHSSIVLYKTGKDEATIQFEERELVTGKGFDWLTVPIALGGGTPGRMICGPGRSTLLRM